MSKKKAKTSEEIKIAVFVNGLPGAVSQEIAKACVRRGLKVAPIALTGPNMPESIDIEGCGAIKLIDAGKTEEAKEALKNEKDSLEKEGYIVIAIDFTHPDAVNPNADLYNSIDLPFVMGTTGGDREKLERSTQESKNHAVIAPNMCKQIVAFQAMFEYMEKNFPGAFSGYDLSVTESHQKTKADTSGTAKAVVKSLSSLIGTSFPEENIKRLRSDEESKAFGVPDQYLTGHAHHTYHLESGDKTVVFEFKHNVNGRSTYGEGAVDAVLYLGNRVANPRNKPKIYSMIDVLKSGTMV